MSVPSDNDRTFHVVDEADARVVQDWLLGKRESPIGDTAECSRAATLLISEAAK